MAGARSRALPVLASIAAGLVLIAGNIWLARAELAGRTLRPDALRWVDSRAAIPGGGTVPDLYRRLLAEVPADAVVLTTAQLGWPLPTFGAKVIAIQDENPLLLDQMQRYQAMAAFFYRPMEDLTRVEIIQRYDADYVLLNTAHPSNHASLQPWLNQYARLVTAIGPLQMYELSRALHAIQLPKPPPPPAPEPLARPAAEAPPAAQRRERPAAVPMILRPPRAPAAEEEGDDTPAYGAPINEPIVDK